MSALVVDAGALVALDRADRDMWADLRRAETVGATVVVPTGVVAQAWRDGARQVRLVRALQSMDELPLDGVVARLAGALCARSGSTDVIDATVALAAASFPPSEPVTLATSDRSDLDDLLELLRAGHVRIRPV